MFDKSQKSVGTSQKHVEKQSDENRKTVGTQSDTCWEQLGKLSDASRKQGTLSEMHRKTSVTSQ